MSYHVSAIINNVSITVSVISQKEISFMFFFLRSFILKSKTSVQVLDTINVLSNIACSIFNVSVK